MPAHPRVDLHAHTTWSDGTESVAQLWHSAQRAGLTTLALTDHDTVAGWAELPAAVEATGVAAVPGIEVSAEHDRLSVHVLALLVDPSPHTDLARELGKARDSRVTRAERMVQAISADHPITWDDVRAQVAGETTTVGRPHIADALVAAGVVRDRAEAFQRILRPSGPYYARYYAPAPAVAVRAILDAGGVPILAHPGSATRDGSLPLDLLESMVDAGLAGVEVDHREHTEPVRARLRDFARVHDLLTTGGSDYHGAGKPNRLGENLTQPDVLDAITSRATSTTEVIRT